MREKRRHGEEGHLIGGVFSVVGVEKLEKKRELYL